MNKVTHAGIRSLNAVKEAMPTTQLAIELYQRAGLKGSIDTYQRHIRGGFDPERDKDFHKWWEVVGMMQITGCHEPLFYLCDLLGYEKPEKIDLNDKAAYHRAELARLKQQMEEHQAVLESLPESKDQVIARFMRNT